MSLSTPKDLLVHGVEDIYYAENELLDALETLAEQSSDEGIVEAFESHREETTEHVERLEQVFEQLGEEPEEEQCEGIDGLIQEHEDFVEEGPAEEILDLHNLVAAKKTERYEITAYEHLISLANRLDMSETAELLEETLEEEEAASDKLTSLAEEIQLPQGEVASD